MRNQKRLVAGLILGIVVLAVLICFFIANFIFDSRDVSLSPPIGTSTVSHVKSFSITSQAAALTSGYLSQTVYPLDGASGICADLFGPNMQGPSDGEEEFYFYNGDRFGAIGPNNENLIYFDGRGLTQFRDGAALIFRVDDGSANENKYVVVKSSQGSCSQNPCPTWYAHRALGVYALNSFNVYNSGQQIVSLPYTNFPICNFSPGPDGVCIRESPPGCICSQTYIYWLTSSDVVLKPNQPVFVTASDRNFETMDVYRLLLASDGTISMTSTGEVGNIVYPAQQPACAGGGSTCSVNSQGLPNCPSAHRGNAMLQVKLQRVNSNGVGTEIYDEYLFNNDFFKINSDGTVTQIGSWHDYDGQTIPITQGGLFTICFPNGATYDHVDTVLTFNAGTEINPDYRMIIMWDGEGARTVSGRISIDQNGVFTLTPLWATVGGSDSVNAAQQLALGYVKGLPGGPHVVNGRYVFDALTGQILADTDLFVTSSNNLFAFNDPRFWPTTTQGSYVTDKHLGFEAQSFQPINSLAHVLPVVELLSAPITTVAPFQLTFKDVGTGLPSGQTPTGNDDQGGIIRNANLCANYNLATNSISFDLVKVRNQQHASLLRTYDVAPFITGVTQAHKDIVLKFLEQSDIAGHRGNSEVGFKRELAALGQPAPNCLGTGSCLTQGVCAGTVPVCNTQTLQWVCNYPINYGNEICDNYDNNCNGQVDEGCSLNAPIAPSNFQANLI